MGSAQRITHALGLLLLGLLLCAGSGSAELKWNITQAVASTLPVEFVAPGDVCDSPGTCVPTNVTIPPSTMWYWCGYKSIYRSIYNVTSISSTSNLTQIMIMRRGELESCALSNVSVVETCAIIPESSCSRQKVCNTRVFGLVFSDPVCLVIINNSTSSRVAQVQYHNFYESARWYGTVFTLFFTILGGLAVFANVGWQFYTIIVAPVSKHGHAHPKPPVQPSDSRSYISPEDINGAAGGSGDAAAAPPAKPESGVGKLYGKIKGILAPGSTKSLLPGTERHVAQE